MADYERTLDLKQGYNFKKDIQKPIGFITSLKIGMTMFAPDQKVNSPIKATDEGAGALQTTAVTGELAVVSVLSKIKWGMGDTDPIEFEGTLSISGKQNFAGLLYATMIDVDVEIGWVVYEYDPLARKYYAAYSNSAQGTLDVSGGTIAQGLIKKDGESLQMTLSPDPGEEVQSPQNYAFTLQVVPQPLAQALLFATSATRKVTKMWGRTGPNQ